jgi:hypothetical protein
MLTIQEEFKIAVDDFTEVITDMVLSKFKDDAGAISPTAYAMVIKKGKSQIAILMGLEKIFTDDEGKETSVEIIKSFNEQIKPVVIAFSTEVWYKRYSIEESKATMNPDGTYKDYNKRPSQMDDKQEGLMIKFETHDKCAMFLYDIIRKGDSVKTRLNKDISHSWTKKEESHTAGKFDALLQKNYSSFAEQVQKDLKQNLN